MTPDLAGARWSDAQGRPLADVDPPQWAAAAVAVRDAGWSCFDLLTAVDEQAAGLDVVLHVWSPAGRSSVLLRTRLPADAPRVASLAGVFAGAAWHERQAAEMFGIAFDGHPGLAPLLLPDGFVGAPLRKEFVLASRVEKPWPGAKEPGESDADLAGAAPTRRRAVPPGVPQPGDWGTT